MSKDYYKTLGVNESASRDEIKRAFRKLAKKYHPDRNNGDRTAEQKFKEVSEAYETLSDEKKRSEYDTLRKYGAFAGAGHSSGTGGFGGGDFAQFFRQGGANGRAFTFRMYGFGAQGGLDEILSSIFSVSPFGEPSACRRTTARVGRAPDIEAELSISFMEAINGASRVITLGNSGKKLRVRFPKGIVDGEKIRLAGQGHAGYNGSRNGDLIITVRVMPDQNFERKGNDVYTSVTVSFVDAIRGAKAKVKTLTKDIMLTIPPGTQPGTRMRLKGQGLAVGGSHGDLYVEIKVEIPKTLTEKQRELLEEWGK